MKRIISALFCIVFFVLTIVPQCFAAGELVEVSQNMPFYMTVLGDSIAAGYGLEGYEKDPCYTCKSYGNILAEKYGLKADDTYHNYAVSGATSSDLIKLIDDKNYQTYIKNSDLIIISIGGNDMLHVLYNAISEALGTSVEDITSVDDIKSKINLMTIKKLSDSISENIPLALEQFETNLNTIIQQLKSVNPNGLIIVQTIYNPFESFEEIELLQTLSSDTIADFNNVILNGAKNDKGEKLYIVSDVAKRFEGKSKELTNINEMDIHPNASGHEEISKLLDEEISAHTFTSWVIDTTADAKDDSNADAEKSRWRNVMAGFFIILLIVVAMIGVVFIKKMKEL